MLRWNNEQETRLMSGKEGIAFPQAGSRYENGNSRQNAKVV